MPSISYHIYPPSCICAHQLCLPPATWETDRDLNQGQSFHLGSGSHPLSPITREILPFPSYITILFHSLLSFPSMNKNIAIKNLKSLLVTLCWFLLILDSQYWSALGPHSLSSFLFYPTHTLGNFIQPPASYSSPYIDNAEMYFCSPDFSVERHTHIYNCLSTAWHGYLKATSIFFFKLFWDNYRLIRPCKILQRGPMYPSPNGDILQKVISILICQKTNSWSYP